VLFSREECGKMFPSDEKEEIFKTMTKEHAEKECQKLRQDKTLNEFYIIKPKEVLIGDKVYWEVEIIRKKTI